MYGLSFKYIKTLKENKLSIIFNYCMVIWFLCSPVYVLADDLQKPFQLEATVKQNLIDARQKKKADYTVRTQHLVNKEPKYINRLILEDSPYLLQHAHNPVNWYAWGEAAFKAARQQNKPIFLSIGYSTCHWCHVMEEESFDNVEVAEQLNRHFISIKVDREQRPDLDEIYMMGVQLMTGSGGWPMSNFLTTDGLPFHGGTYFPRHQFLNTLKRIHEIWSKQPEKLKSNAVIIYSAIKDRLNKQGEAVEIGKNQIDQALQQILLTEDKEYGGRLRAPKFPNESSLMLLLQQIERSPNAFFSNPYWQTLHRALDGMMRGGIYDQLAGGFHRYSVDEKWLVPHFEKMLYNQAQLSRLYVRAWKISGNNEFKRIAQETLDYVLTEMRSQQGAFYSASDADSEGQEGTYYVWSYDELKNSLNPAEFKLLQQVYGVTEQGNFESSNILFLDEPLQALADQLKLDQAELWKEISQLKSKLLKIRQLRIPPFRDTKVITQWNSMMITSLAESGHLLAEKKYINAAIQAADFIWAYNRNEQGLLYRIHLNGSSSIKASLEDYSYYLESVLTLYDVTEDKKWLNIGLSLHTQMTDLFWNKQVGGFYNSQQETAGPMIIRSQSASDGATASGNSVALVALVALQKRAKSFSLQEQIDRQILYYSSALNESPLSLSYMLLGINDYHQNNPAMIQYAGNGHVRLTARFITTDISHDELIIDLNIDKGWHINASSVTLEDLVATELKVKNRKIKQLEYPRAFEKKVFFKQKRLRLYQAKIQIVAQLKKADFITSNKPLSAEISLQACSEQLCLAPETINLLLH